jgi:hypothetical protein
MRVRPNPPQGVSAFTLTAMSALTGLRPA